MDRSTAIQRVKDGLGFKSGTSLDSRIVSRLSEAQRKFEKGQTLPKFLIVEDFSDTLAAGTHTIPKPTGFLRMVEDQRPHFTAADSDVPVFLTRKTNYADAIQDNIRETDDPTKPSVYVIRKTVIDFINTADIDYEIVFSYFKAGDDLLTNTSNVWLDNIPELLIGESGRRIAADARNKTAMDLFTTMMQEAKVAIFGEDIAEELEDAPLFMGSNL